MTVGTLEPALHGTLYVTFIWNLRMTSITLEKSKRCGMKGVAIRLVKMEMSGKGRNQQQRHTTLQQ